MKPSGIRVRSFHPSRGKDGLVITLLVEVFFLGVAFFLEVAEAFFLVEDFFFVELFFLVVAFFFVEVFLVLALLTIDISYLENA
jgi:hypothetical protein